MKIYIDKVNSVIYLALSPEINDLVISDERIIGRYAEGIEGKGRSVGAAIADFNSAFRVFIEYYIEVTGDIPEFLKDKKVEYCFDDDAFSNYYLNEQKKKKHPMPDFLFAGHEKLSGDILEQNLENADPNNPFYDKKVVFTGVLNNLSREDAAAKVKAMGADINTSISSLTNFVIVGEDAGRVKMKKIEMLNTDGAEIKIITEPEFLEMIK